MSSTASTLPVYTPFSPRTILTDLPRSHTRQYGQADGPSESTTGEDPSLTPEVQYHHSRSRAAAHRARREHTGGRSVLDSLLHTAISFLYSTGMEWVSLVLVGGLGIALTWFSYPVLDRVFPLTSANGTLYRSDIAYPCLEPIFSPAAAGALAALIPITTFLLCQLYYRSFHDFASATLGLGYSLTTGTLVQLVLKKHIGGLRPHFLDVCQPQFPDRQDDLSLRGVGFNHMMYNVSICSAGLTWEVRNAMESFPSGHAAIAFAGFGYLALYLFAHLRISRRNNRSAAADEAAEGDLVSQRDPRDVCAWLESRKDLRCLRYARMLAVVAPLTFATYLSATLVLGYQHHAHDVVAGGLIGMGAAVLGYRTAFQGVLDWPWNCVPVTTFSSLQRDGGREVGDPRGGENV